MEDRRKMIKNKENVYRNVIQIETHLLKLMKQIYAAITVDVII